MSMLAAWPGACSRSPNLELGALREGQGGKRRVERSVASDAGLLLEPGKHGSDPVRIEVACVRLVCHCRRLRQALGAENVVPVGVREDDEDERDGSDVVPERLDLLGEDPRVDEARLAVRDEAPAL